MNAIIGTYECKADVKGRLIMPSPLKKQLIAVLNDGFVLKRSIFDTSLELWPMAEWNIMLKKISKLNTINNKNNDFIKKFLAGVKIIEIDDLGRLLIPKDLLSFSKISKDVVFAGKLNIIEIWDKEVYEKAIDFDENEFAQLAEEVMNTVTDDE